MNQPSSSLGMSSTRKVPVAKDKVKTKLMKLKCCFCNDNEAVVIIEKSFTSSPYCLFHYYTTKACRIDTSKVSLIESEDSDELHAQLPYVQELFAEAFTELQNEVAIESARSFQSMVGRDDPLSILIDSSGKQNRKKKTKLRLHQQDIGCHENIDDEEGGFIRHLQNSKEAFLMEEQSRRIELAAKESVNSIHHSINLSKRRKTSSKSSWHLVLDKKTDEKIINHDLNNNEIRVAHGIKCSCGSENVIMHGSVAGRNDAISQKAEIWGVKRDNEISGERFQCMNCNKIWYEDE